MRNLFIILYLFMAIQISFAQESWEYFTSKQNVNCIDFEEDNIWIGTTGGIVKQNTIDNSHKEFDYNEGLTMPNVNAMAIDSSGVKWFAMNLYKKSSIEWALFSFDNNNWKKYTTENSGLPSNKINTLKVNSKGHLYIGTDKGLAVLADNNWQVFNTTNSEIIADGINCIAFDSQENVWIGTYLGLSKFSGSSWTNFGVNIISWIMDIKIDQLDNVWCAIGNDSPYGLKIIKPDGSIREISYQNSDIPKRWIRDICFDNNKVWLITGSYDQYNEIMVSNNGTNWTTFNSSNSILTNYIKSIKKDKKNRIWICTDKGLIKVENDNWEQYPIQSLQPGVTLTITPDRNNGIWFGGNPGVSYYKNNHWYNYHVKNSGIGSNWVKSITLDNDNNVWFSAVDENSKYTQPGYISKFNGTEWTLYNKYTDPIINNSYIMEKLVFDKNNNLWFIKDGGIVKYDGTIWQYMNPPNVEMVPRTIDIVVDSRNNIWFATGSQGVLKYDHINWTFYNTENSNLSNNSIFAIDSDKENNIWVKTKHTISCFDGSNWTNYNYQNDHTISIGNNNGLAIDSLGVVWASVDSGLYKLENAELTFIEQTDMNKPLVDIWEICVDQANNKWLGTYRNGLIKLLDHLPTGINETETVAISGYHLLNNFPNPFNGATTLSYTLQNPGYVNITIYNMLGQKVATLVDGYQTGLQYTVKWNGTNDFGEPASSGIYFARMQTGDYTKTIKMAFVE